MSFAVPTIVPSTAGSIAGFHQPIYPASRHYYPTAPMSAVLPGQAYYPTAAPMTAGYAMPMTAAVPATAYPYAAPMSAYGYGGMPMYGARPTVIIGSPPSRRHRRHRSRGFLGYL